MSFVRFLLTSLIISLCASAFTFSAKIVVQPLSDQNFYECPFDVEIYVDAQGENIEGASIRTLLNSGLVLKGYAFADTFNLGFPARYDNNELSAYGFKFPGTFSGLVKFATLRLQQNDRNITTNELQFLWSGKPDTLDNVDVYYFGGKDALTAIQNKPFAFQQGSCPTLMFLSGDQLSSSYDSQGHLMDLYTMIDEFAKNKQKAGLWGWVEGNIYLASSLLLLLLLIVVFSVLYKTGKLNKFFKHNSGKHV